MKKIKQAFGPIKPDTIRIIIQGKNENDRVVLESSFDTNIPDLFKELVNGVVTVLAK